MKIDATCSRLRTLPLVTGPKRSMGHVMGAKKGIFLIRGRGRPTVYGGRACGILSIPAQEVSLGSPRAGTIHVHAPTPHTPPLQAFLADFSQQTTRFSHLLAIVNCGRGPRDPCSRRRMGHERRARAVGRANKRRREAVTVGTTGTVMGGHVRNGHNLYARRPSRAVSVY